MSKKIIALAIAALAPAAAMAENANVTMYGVIDYGYAIRQGNRSNGDAATDRLQTNGKRGRLGEFAGGISAGNRIGFKGAEDLGNGLKAIFEIEFGFKGDDTSGTTFNKNRHSWVGLTGNWGTLLGGRVDGARYSFTGKYDPFKNQSVGNAASIFGYTSNLGQADRADNAIVYVSPSFAGFSFLGAYTKSLLNQEGTGGALGIAQASRANGFNISNGDTPLFALAAMYDNGPLSATVDYENLKIIDYGNAFTGNAHFNIFVTGASYDFGPVKLSGYFEATKGKKGLNNAADNIKGRGWLLGLSAPIGPVTLRASYVDGRDRTNNNGLAGNGTAQAGKNDCRKFAIGADYNLSKRTAFYTDLARVRADEGATCGITLAGSTNAGSNAGTNSASNAAYGKTGFDIGLRHSF